MFVLAAETVSLDYASVAVVGGIIGIVLALIKFGDRLWGQRNGKGTKTCDEQLNQSMLKLNESLLDYTREVQSIVIKMDERDRLSEARHQEIIRMLQSHRGK